MGVSLWSGFVAHLRAEGAAVAARTPENKRAPMGALRVHRVAGGPLPASAYARGASADKCGERERRFRARRRYDVVLSNTPPEAFSLRASSAYSDSTSRRSLSPVLASGIDTILRPFREASAHTP